MNSCLYECTVFHRRFAPKRHEFLYRVFYFLLDLDELGELDRTLCLFGVNRPGLYSFRDSDHISHGAATARENILRYLRDQGIDDPVGNILLLTLPRVLGHVFNPISVFFCLEHAEEAARPPWPRWGTPSGNGNHISCRSRPRGPFI